ncbi:MAG TPA: amidohydrolase [Clostridiales bacterium]|nr:amidohydrolase [Clostridiales bacterium]HCG35633.1 amidohydrolase [Clostridiales bacterium]
MQALDQFSIIDFHTHIFPDKLAVKAADNISTYYSLPREGDGTLQTLKRLSHDLLIKAYIVSSAATSAKNVCVANDFMAEQASRDKQLVGLGTTHTAFKNQEKELERIISLGLKGIKLHCDFQGFPIDDPGMDAVYKKASELKLPILFHLGDENTDFTTPRRMRNVIDRHPDLIVIAAHMGGYLHMEASKELLVGLPIYFDTSEWNNIMRKDELVQMCRDHGIERILFGCDYPIYSTYSAATALYEAGFTEEELVKIFYSNASTLLQIS